MLDWIFEGIVTWISSVVSDMMDAVSGLFLQALGTDMTAMEEYFPFVSKAFTVMQYTAWALLFLITVWQLFRVFGGPVTEAENPWIVSKSNYSGEGRLEYPGAFLFVIVPLMAGRTKTAFPHLTTHAY